MDHAREGPRAKIVRVVDIDEFSRSQAEPHTALTEARGSASHYNCHSNESLRDLRRPLEASLDGRAGGSAAAIESPTSSRRPDGPPVRVVFGWCSAAEGPIERRGIDHDDAVGRIMSARAVIVVLAAQARASKSCDNDGDWWSKKEKKDCGWVGKKPDKRCKLKTKNNDDVSAFAGCPEACGVCELECGEDSDVWYWKKTNKVRDDRVVFFVTPRP